MAGKVLYQLAPLVDQLIHPVLDLPLLGFANHTDQCPIQTAWRISLTISRIAKSRADESLIRILWEFTRPSPSPKALRHVHRTGIDQSDSVGSNLLAYCYASPDTGIKKTGMGGRLTVGQV